MAYNRAHRLQLRCHRLWPWGGHALVRAGVTLCTGGRLRAVPHLLGLVATPAPPRQWEVLLPQRHCDLLLIDSSFRIPTDLSICRLLLGEGTTATPAQDAWLFPFELSA